MKKLLSVLLIIMFVVLFESCKKTNLESVETDIDSTNEVEQIDISVEDESAEETTEPITNFVEENPFHYRFKYIDDEYVLFYKAPVNGKYRFDLNISDVNDNYSFKLYDSINEEIVNINFDNYEHGETVQLNKNETYKLVISQLTGLPEATIKIWIPNEKEIIGSNSIEGSINFIGQEDNYTFIPEISGVYRFDFITTDVNSDYKFLLMDKKNDILIDSHYDSYSNGENVSLTSGKEYFIQVLQYEGFPEYEIKISKPLSNKTVNGSFSGKISFIGQENTYYYTPNRTGEYKIYTLFGNKEGSCRLKLIDKQNEEYIDTTSEYPNEVVLKQGEEYRFIVSYYSLFMNYQVIIE